MHANLRCSGWPKAVSGRGRGSGAGEMQGGILCLGSRMPQARTSSTADRTAFPDGIRRMQMPLKAFPQRTLAERRRSGMVRWSANRASCVLPSLRRSKTPSVVVLWGAVIAATGRAATRDGDICAEIARGSEPRRRGARRMVRRHGGGPQAPWGRCGGLAREAEFRHFVRPDAPVRAFWMGRRSPDRFGVTLPGGHA